MKKEENTIVFNNSDEKIHNLYKNSGITLIALVVTIIVLLILAGITLNLLLGDTGIFEKAKNSEDAYKIGALKDKIYATILDWEVEKKIPNTTGDETIGTLESLWDKFVDADIIDNPEEDIYHQEGTDIYEVTTNEGYVVEIVVKEDGTVEIVDVVREDKAPPRIRKITSSVTSSSIHVEVSIARSTGKVKLSYYYKKDGEDDNSYIALKEDVTELTADFTELKQNIIYNIKVVVTDDNGSTEKVISERTGELAEGTIKQVEDSKWSNGTATLKLETTETEEGIYIVYQIGDIDGEWIPYEEEGISGLNHGDIVYAAISDGTNVSKESSFEIEDGIGPTVTVTKGTVTTKNIAVSVSSLDSQWGMPTSATYNYYIKKSTETSYPTKASYTGTNTSYTFDNLNQTTSYDIKVTTVDKAGNEGSNELTGVSTGTIGGATSGLASGNIKASSPTWSGGKASITLSKGTGVASNLSIQWQKNSVSGTWTTGTSVTGLNHNDTVYARLTDGRNNGQEASVKITDGTAPTVNITKGAVTTKSIAVSVSSTDSQWGMPSSISYSYYIKTSSTTNYPTTASYTGTNTSYTFNNLSQTTSYDIKVTTTDKAGNIGTGTLLNQTTGTIGGATSGLVSGNIKASSPTWSGGKASITLSTSTGLTIQWQKNSISGGWTTGTSVTGLVHNDTVYARLTDGTNYGNYGSVIIKNTAPSNLSMTFSSKTTNSITVNATANDVNGDRLTYSLYTSTSASSGYTLKNSTTATPGQRISLTASNLSMYTTYYYYVIVSDGINTQTSSNSSVRTFCSGTTQICNTLYCAGNVECYECLGRGYTYEPCPGGSIVTGTYQCTSCWGYGTRYFMY